MTARTLIFGLLFGAGSAASGTTQAQTFDVVEAGIPEIRRALLANEVTCADLTRSYLRRIEAYDKTGPALNSMVVLNSDVLRVADSLDGALRSGAPPGRLHCIPMIVKDNFETLGLATTAGSASLAGFVSDKDAFMVRRLREEGALVLGKSNMAEFAFSPLETVNSILPGHTRNPYDTSRTTAGSSGGTAAAVAASFGAAGLGTDTGNSIRGPSSHQALVGIRSTMGLTSRAGVVPLSYAADIAGPMARTVTDATLIFEVVSGYDPADPVTEPARARPVVHYLDSLRSDGLRGARIGVLRQAYERPSADSQVLAVFARAVEELRSGGATVLDSVVIGGLDSLRMQYPTNCNRFKFDFESWIASTGGRTPVKSLDDVLASGAFHPSVRSRLQSAATASVPPAESPTCRNREPYSSGVAAAVSAAMDSLGLDALVYPTWSNPPREITDTRSPTGDNSQFFSPITGWPAVQVPIGYTYGNTLPAGMTFLGRGWSEATLLRLAYSYEQLTKHRRAPALTPPLR